MLNTNISKTLSNKFQANMSALIEEVEYKGKMHLKVPIVMATVGVMNELLYTEEELSKTPEIWNGRTIVVYHPDKNGTPVTANSPQVLETMEVGTIFDARFEDGKLKCNGYIDPDKVENISPKLWDYIQNDVNTDVSTGLILDVAKGEGVHNGERYKGIAVNYRPDHLAILPDVDGACDWSKGAGLVRNHKKNTEEIGNMDDGKQGIFAKFMSAIDSLGSQLSINADEVSHDALKRAINKKLHAGAESDECMWVAEVFDTYFVYEKKDMLYKQSFAMSNDTGEITFEGEPIRVMIKKEYVPIPAEVPAEVVIVNDGQDKLEEPDSGLALNESNTGKEVEMDEIKTIDELMANEAVAQEIKDAVKAGQDAVLKANEAEAEAKAKLVEKVVSFEANQFDKKELGEMKVNMLEKIVAGFEAAVAGESEPEKPAITDNCAKPVGEVAPITANAKEFEGFESFTAKDAE